MPKSIPLPNSRLQSTAIIVIGPDTDELQVFEAKSEVDPDLARVSIFTTSSVSEGAILAAKHSAKLAVFADGTEGKDFVYIQAEIRNSSPRCKCIPIVDVPSISQLREAQRLGGLVDFYDRTCLLSYQKLKDLLVAFLREHVAARQDPDDAMKDIEPICRALAIGHKDWSEIKNSSSQTLHLLLEHYDLSLDSAFSISLSERLFFPWVTASEYKSVLREDPYHLLPVVLAAASWTQVGSKPSSAEGLIVTLTNYIAHALYGGQDSSLVIDSILDRPEFLKHPAIRTVSKEKLQIILKAVQKLDSIAS